MLRFHLNTHNNTVVVPHTKIYILIYRFIILHFRNCKIVNCVCRKVKKNGYVFDAVLKNHAIFKKADLEKDANFLKNMTFISSLMQSIFIDLVEKKYPHNQELNLFYSGFLFHEKSLVAKSSFMANEMIQKRLGLRLFHVCNRLIYTIKDRTDKMNVNHSQEKDHSHINLKKMERMDQSHKKLESHIISFYDAYTLFFNLLVRSSISNRSWTDILRVSLWQWSTSRCTISRIKSIW